MIRLSRRGRAPVKAETNGDPGRTRTCDQQLRRLSLYPAELRDRISLNGPAGAVQCVQAPTRLNLKLSE
jgi:hypothetical protein